jgi:N-acetylmuramoyl-L-alanine amidase
MPVIRPIEVLIAHHTAGPEHATVAELRAEHLRRGWSDIGYHFVQRRIYVGGPWVIEPGRPLELVGAHDADQNVGSIGVAICGNYANGRPVDPWGWRIFVEFLAQLCVDFRIDPARKLEGHGENEPPATRTLCPGFAPALLRQAVGEAMRRAA